MTIQFDMQAYFQPLSIPTCPCRQNFQLGSSLKVDLDLIVRLFPLVNCTKDLEKYKCRVHGEILVKSGWNLTFEGINIRAAAQFCFEWSIYWARCKEDNPPITFGQIQNGFSHRKFTSKRFTFIVAQTKFRIITRTTRRSEELSWITLFYQDASTGWNIFQCQMDY